MKKIGHFVRNYKWFALALFGAVLALILQITGNSGPAQAVLTVTAAIQVIYMLTGMYADLREGRYGVDILAVTAIVVAVIMHEYWAATVIILMLTGGEALEDYAEHRARTELDALLSRAPQKARILRGQTEVEILASKVEIGDKVIIRPGEVVPVDAKIIEGLAAFDESSLTGESMPQIHKVGEEIMSGSVDQDGAIVAEALRSAANSQYEQIVKLVQDAAKSQAPFVRLADKYAIPFTIISFGIAGAAWAISGDSMRFLQVLVVATPCPLILAAPIAIISGMSRAAKHGIIVKNGSALEKLAEAETFAFDKTGTLTIGRPQVEGVKTYNKFTAREVLGLAASLERSSNHVLAEAIVNKAEAAKADIPKTKHVKELAGHGLSAKVGAKEVLVGRMSMMNDYKVETPAGFSIKDIQSTASFVAIDGKLAGVISFRDEIRPDTKKTIADLFSLGVKSIMMITGDNKHVAKKIAGNLGITEFYADMLPGDKIMAIEKAKHRPVAFIGDGVNDAPALTASDLGIALGARGSTAASESADVVIMLEGLEHVAEARRIAKRTFFIAQQSILIGIGLSVMLMLIFSTGKFKPIYGAAIQEVVDVVVIFNALRAHGSFGKKSLYTAAKKNSK